MIFKIIPKNYKNFISKFWWTLGLNIADNTSPATLTHMAVQAAQIGCHK